jgi:magnesium chelatase family protein
VRRLPSILPPLTFPEALEVSRLDSVCGLLPSGKALLSRRPFRGPHHSISDAGLIGGGSRWKKGRSHWRRTNATGTARPIILLNRF